MKFFFTLFISFLLAACANISMPTGGPKDEIPPELVSSSPSNNELNFSGKIIELTFNEDIKLKDPKEEILIVPSVGKKTLFTVRKKKLIIEPELEWLPNTTYSINFRDGVQDITEGNPAENLRLAFSTGPVIDSLNISGRVKDLFSENIPAKITIALYTQDTFDIFRHTPIYFTKSNKEGVFTLPNLKSDNYYVYAYDDKNKNLKVDSKTEKFGYLANPINPLNIKDSVELAMTVIDSRALTITSIRHTDKTSRLRFNKQIDSLIVNGISPSQSIYSYGTDQSELVFYNTFLTGDSIKTNLIAKDSIGQKIDTVFYLKYGEVKTAEETLKTKEILQQYDTQTKSFKYILSYNKPLGALTMDSIYIKYDSLDRRPLASKDIKIDTLLNQITFKAIIEEIPTRKEDKKKPEPPLFILGKGALITIDQDSLRGTTKAIKITKEDDLGTVALNVETKEKNYIVQIITTDNKVVRSLSNIKNYTVKNLEPKEYKLRIIIDTNNNGKWDVGNFYTKTESEKILFYKSEEGKYSFPLRANWEYGPVLIKF